MPKDTQGLIKQGGAAEQSVREQIRTKKQFPSDYQDFYPKLNEDDIIKKAQRLADQKARLKVPKQVVGLEVQPPTPVSINGRTMVRIVTTFQQDNDPNFFGAYLWIKGYQTDNALADYDEDAVLDPNVLGAEETLPFQRQATLTSSPSTMYLEATSEKIIIGVEAFNKDGIGAGIFSMPIQTIELL